MQEINYDFRSNLVSFLPRIVCRKISIFRTICFKGQQNPKPLEKALPFCLALRLAQNKSHKDFSQTMFTPLTPRLMPLVIIERSSRLTNKACRQSLLPSGYTMLGLVNMLPDLKLQTSQISHVKKSRSSILCHTAKKMFVQFWKQI